ncbi:MAG: prohibitin family protein [Bacteroidetes bacterium]|nr:prohibitin family protein [Bacteroidota bacterium]
MKNSYFHQGEVRSFRKKILFATPLIVSMFVFNGCVTIHPGEVGIVTEYGRMQSKTFTGGRHMTDLFGRRVIKMSTRVVEYSATEHLPTKEGLEIQAEVTLLYHLKPESAQSMYETFGLNYGNILVVNNFIAIAREATLNYYAKDIITERENLEVMMRQKLEAAISSYGIVIDALLLKDIDLPDQVMASIQEKVKDQQELENAKVNIEKQRIEQEYALEKDSIQVAYDMQKRRQEEDFAIEQQKKEAERMEIEAKAKANANSIESNSLTDKILKEESINMSRELMASPNSKVIITDGTSTLHVSPN